MSFLFAVADATSVIVNLLPFETARRKASVTTTRRNAGVSGWEGLSSNRRVVNGT